MRPHPLQVGNCVCTITKCTDAHIQAQRHHHQQRHPWIVSMLLLPGIQSEAAYHCTCHCSDNNQVEHTTAVTDPLHPYDCSLPVSGAEWYVIARSYYNLQSGYNLFHFSIDEEATLLSPIWYLLLSHFPCHYGHFCIEITQRMVLGYKLRSSKWDGKTRFTFLLYHVTT